MKLFPQMKPVKHIYALLLVFVLCEAHSQNKTFYVGPHFQKTIKMYYENGVSGYFQSENILNSKLLTGLHIISSRLGTAIGSNAIKQEEYLLSAHFIMRKGKKLEFITGISSGFFHSDYESVIFKNLQNNSLLLAPEAGIKIPLIKSFTLISTGGYQLMNGHGDSGAGTLYPFYFQISMLWAFQK